MVIKSRSGPGVARLLHQSQTVSFSRASRGTRGVLWSAMMVSGCAIGPDYHPASPARLGIPDRYIAGQDNPPPDMSRWWAVFRDPVLSDLIARATADNLSLAQSAERLVQAREALTQAKGARLPGLSFTASKGRYFNAMAGQSDSPSAQVTASWNVDLLGGLSRAQQSSAASLQGAGFDLAATRISIASQVAQNYIDYREGIVRLQIARDTLRTQDDNLDIARWRAAAGLVSLLDVEQARTQRAQTSATIPPLVESTNSAKNQVSILVGQAPGAVDGLLAPFSPVPLGPASIALGIPADTLRLRPDVRSSERALAAATAEIGVAKAQLYPQLTLSGNIGIAALSLGSMGEVITGSLFSTLTQTLFDGGQLKSKVRVKESAARAAFASYKATVLSALQDVENDDVALSTANDRVNDLAMAADAANSAAILARSQYRSGLTTFQTLLSAEQTLLSARDSLVVAQAAQAVALVQLYAALGGGWDAGIPAGAVFIAPMAER